MDASLYLFFFTRPHSLAYATRVPTCSVAHLILFLSAWEFPTPPSKPKISPNPLIPTILPLPETHGITFRHVDDALRLGHPLGLASFSGADPLPRSTSVRNRPTFFQDG